MVRLHESLLLRFRPFPVLIFVAPLAGLHYLLFGTDFWLHESLLRWVRQLAFKSYYYRTDGCPHQSLLLSERLLAFMNLYYCRQFVGLRQYLILWDQCLAFMSPYCGTDGWFHEFLFQNKWFAFMNFYYCSTVGWPSRVLIVVGPVFDLTSPYYCRNLCQRTQFLILVGSGVGLPEFVLLWDSWFAFSSNYSRLLLGVHEFLLLQGRWLALTSPYSCRLVSWPSRFFGYCGAVCWRSQFIFYHCVAVGWHSGIFTIVGSLVAFHQSLLLDRWMVYYMLMSQNYQSSEFKSGQL